ncbi:MAG: D-alanyl-D-alanine carboxypeptidase family protein [Planctomyces sp.]
MRRFRRQWPSIAVSGPALIYGSTSDNSWPSPADSTPTTVPASNVVPVSPAPLTSGTATDLVSVAIGGSGTIRLQRRAAVAWGRLIAAARRQGVASPLLSLRAGNATIGRQRRVWESAVQAHGSEEEARRWCVVPGTPTSQDGLSFEVFLGSAASAGSPQTASSLPAYRWLRANARRFGFVPHGRSAVRWVFVEASSDRRVGGELSEVPQAAAAGTAAAAAGTAATWLSIAQLGVALWSVAPTLKGGTHSTSQTAEYRHANTPTNITWYRTEYEFTIEARSAWAMNGTETFRFAVVFEHNGYDLRQVHVREQGSDPLISSTMSVNFGLQPKSANNEVNLSLYVNMSGSWDPVGLGEYAFSPGTLSVDAQGRCQIERGIYQAEDKVVLNGLRKLSTVNLGGGQPQPPGPAPVPGGTDSCAARTAAGCSGPVVTELQVRLNRWLNARGMAPLEVDSQWGRKTAGAVVAFKREHQLMPADAVAGPRTWAILRARY